MDPGRSHRSRSGRRGRVAASTLRAAAIATRTRVHHQPEQVTYVRPPCAVWVICDSMVDADTAVTPSSEQQEDSERLKEIFTIACYVFCAVWALVWVAKGVVGGPAVAPKFVPRKPKKS
jgi:hypothetical protein